MNWKGILLKKNIRLLITRLDLKPQIEVNMSDKVFADGLIVKEGNFHEGKAHLKLSVKVVDFAKFVKEYSKGEWLNLEIKTSKGGKVYCELDTWQPKKEPTKATTEEDSLPF